MKTFDSELREITYNLVGCPQDKNNRICILCKETAEEYISDLKLLISKYAPKERKVSNYGVWHSRQYYNKGFNLYRAELFREMGIDEKS